MNADWFSAIVALATALFSLIFSILSFSQARSALARADQALDLERASSAVTHYLAAIGDSEKLYETIRSDIKDLGATAKAGGHSDEDLRILVLRNGDRIISDFESLLIANRDMIDEDSYAELKNMSAKNFVEQIDMLFEKSRSAEDGSYLETNLTAPLSELAYAVNRYTAYLRQKLFERRSKLTGIRADSASR